MSLSHAALRVTLWFAACWLALAALTLPLWPWGHATSFEHDDEHRSRLFVSEIQAAVFELGRSCPMPPRPRLVLLGGSGARAFKPAELRGFLPGVEVLGLAMDYSNFTQIGQVVDDVAACLGDEGMRQATFVLVPSFMSFVDDHRRFTGGPTVWSAEKLRSQLWRQRGDEIVPAVPRAWLPAAIELSRPVFLVRKLSYRLGAAFDDRAARLRVRLGGTPPPPKPDREQEYRWRVHLLPEPEGRADFAPEQTAVLEGLAERLEAGGARLVIAEQPTQAWLRERSRAFVVSHELLRDFAAERGLFFVDLSHAADDAEFGDALHANPQGARLWTRRLGEALMNGPKATAR